MMWQGIKKLIKKIKQAHCKHEWEHGIATFVAKRTIYPGWLVSTDDLGNFMGMEKWCKKCEKTEADKDIYGQSICKQVFVQVVGRAQAK